MIGRKEKAGYKHINDAMQCSRCAFLARTWETRANAGEPLVTGSPWCFPAGGVSNPFQLVRSDPTTFSASCPFFLFLSFSSLFSSTTTTVAVSSERLAVLTFRRQATVLAKQISTFPQLLFREVNARNVATVLPLLRFRRNARMPEDPLIPTRQVR